MTLFETVPAPPSELNDRRTSHLPAPTKPRFVPLRAGILNMWEYDDQQFWFADGRLLLRGRNEAGKSKVLELLFPFVLDGDMDPRKLDPFATESKSMYWNLLEWEKDIVAKPRASTIGYLWLEFGRLDEQGLATYLTAIVGLQTTASEKKVHPWFALTPQRIDSDLELAPGDVPRTQESFTKALSPEARFETKATQHRAHIAHHLFAMSPERYGNLLHLLRQLRRPKLAEKLDGKKLSTILTNALPPLDESRLRDLAEGFGLLDTLVQELAQADVAHSTTTAFLDVYRAYARAQVRERARLVVRAARGFDDVTRDETAAERVLAEARDKTKRLGTEAGQLARDLATAAGNLSGLDLSAVETLHGLQQVAESHATALTAAKEEAERSQDRFVRAESFALARSNDEDAARGAVAEKLQTAEWAAEKADVSAGWTNPADHARSAENLAGAARVRRTLIDAVADAERRAGGATRELETATERAGAATARTDEAADDHQAAAAAAETARTDFERGFGEWIDDAPAHLDADLAVIVDDISGDLRSGDKTVLRVVAELTAPAVSAAEDAVHLATRAAADADRDLAADRRALEQHDSLPADLPPPRRPGVPAVRVGMPLWRSVEFTDPVNPTERALLEAALEASGLLDAVVTREGLLTDDDTILTGTESAVGLVDWLRPAGDVDHDLVTTAIGAIGAGSVSGDSCWVDLDGTWANGPLAGRWSKASPEYIGAAARAEARALRHLTLVSAVELASERAASAASTLLEARADQTTLTAWKDRFPSVTAWAGAERDIEGAATHLQRANAAQAEATTALKEVQERVAGTLAALAQAVAVAACGPDDVADARAALDIAADAARDLSVAADVLSGAVARAAAAVADSDRLGAEASEAHGRADVADLIASESAARYDTALATEGAEVEAILAEKDRLEQQLHGLRTRKDRVDTQQRAARDDEIRAEGTLAEIGRRRVEALEERDAALAALVVVVRSGHVALAVDVDASRDATDYLRPTAGTALARQIAATVEEDEGTDEARSRATERLVKEFQNLQAEIGGSYNPHLDSVEPQLFQASATLNGSVVGIGELSRALGEDVEQRRGAIDARERDLIEQHLRDEVGNHLGECLHAASTQVTEINEVLRRHPTSSGSIVQLQWKVDDTAGGDVGDAVKALLTAPSTRSEDASRILASFLTERVAMARRGDVEGADLGERLLVALDYRTWYSFALRLRAHGQEAQMTTRTVGAGSGGQQAKLGHLPLLAAAAAFYSSSPSAPRLCVLDEAFAGIDGPNTTDLLVVAVTLDLDMVMTNFDAWFCVPQVPGLAIYHLEKLRDTPGVAAIRYEWDGDAQQELDPWLGS